MITECNYCDIETPFPVRLNNNKIICPECIENTAKGDITIECDYQYSYHWNLSCFQSMRAIKTIVVEKELVRLIVSEKMICGKTMGDTYSEFNDIAYDIDKECLYIRIAHMVSMDNKRSIDEIEQISRDKIIEMKTHFESSGWNVELNIKQ